ncbi:prepilin peptidase [Candidatus Photodesmus anomalopis]|uniref:prepilin peptidase n=1 Tax=Candidatus Photodesmus anomalopis TaxID=28176 RepID=UPI00059017FE|nr:A24 family peptidase [Candidatus Photodesmus katoptron]
MSLFNYFPWLFPSLATVFGLIIGSFLNVVIYRLPIIMEYEWRKECSTSFPEYKIILSDCEYSLISPSSKCRKCNTQLRLIDNIPIISWLMLKGKCYSCGNSISFRYPLIELLSAITSFLIATHFGFSFFSISLLFFNFILIIIAFIDLDTMLLPDQLTLFLVWSGILLALMNISPVSLKDSTIGAIVGYLFLWNIYWLFKLGIGKDVMGYGDFKLLSALGAWLGWQYLPMVVFLSSLIGLCFGISQFRFKKNNEAFPFGPFLVIAGWISLIFGEPIIAWYFDSVIELI